MAKASPTRMNLLSRKSQLGFAREGVQLLKHKREVLMAEFMKTVRPLMEKHTELHRELAIAFNCLNTARSVDGLGEIEMAALLREHHVSIEIASKKNWGIEMPVIKSVDGLGEMYQEPHALDVSLRTFETRDRFEIVMQHILEIAPLEASLKRLGREIQKTTRRINALEIMLIPRLLDEIRSIRGALEEREREDNYRLRRIKNKKES